MKNYKSLVIEEQGTKYHLPKFRVLDGIGIKELNDLRMQEAFEAQMVHIPSMSDYQEITFVRGDRTDNGKVIPRVDGILHEQLLHMMILDLEYKNDLVPAPESDQAIIKLKEALMWLDKRSEDRQNRNVQGTYKK